MGRERGAEQAVARCKRVRVSGVSDSIEGGPIEDETRAELGMDAGVMGEGRSRALEV